MKVRLSDIACTPCAKYYYYIIEKYGEDGEFDPIEVFENVPEGANACDVRWFIEQCRKAQTAEMLEYYKGMSPKHSDVSWLICNCKIAQTPEMLEYYKSLDPTVADIHWLIEHTDSLQTPEMFKYYIESEPGCLAIDMLIKRKKARTIEMLEYLASLEIEEQVIKYMADNCEFVRENLHVFAKK